MSFRSIRRIIFYSMKKPTTNENGEREIDVISVSSALQIAGELKKKFDTTLRYNLLLVLQEEPVVSERNGKMAL